MIKKGFTLIELLVVATIIATLIGVASVSFIRATKASRDTRRKTDLEQIRQALETYRSENGSYPNVTTIGALASALAPGYITTLPQYGPKGVTDTYTFTRTAATTYNLCANAMEITIPNPQYCVHEP